MYPEDVRVSLSFTFQTQFNLYSSLSNIGLFYIMIPNVVQLFINKTSILT